MSSHRDTREHDVNFQVNEGLRDRIICIVRQRLVHSSLDRLPLLSPHEAQNGVELDCDTIPTCRMTCDGPNEKLMMIVVVHAGCMVEWLFHAGWLKGVATVIMFVFLNLSRAVIVGGIVRLNWRYEMLIEAARTFLTAYATRYDSPHAKEAYPLAHELKSIFTRRLGVPFAASHVGVIYVYYSAHECVEGICSRQHGLLDSFLKDFPMIFVSCSFPPRTHDALTTSGVYRQSSSLPPPPPFPPTRPTLNTPR